MLCYIFLICFVTVYTEILATTAYFRAHKSCFELLNLENNSIDYQERVMFFFNFTQCLNLVFFVSDLIQTTFEIDCYLYGYIEYCLSIWLPGDAEHETQAETESK